MGRQHPESLWEKVYQIYWVQSRLLEQGIVFTCYPFEIGCRVFVSVKGCRTVASLSLPGGQDKNISSILPHFPVGSLIFPQIFFLILVFRVGEGRPWLRHWKGGDSVEQESRRSGRDRYSMDMVEVCTEKIKTSKQLLTAHNWQKWKSRFLTCPCHEIHGEQAVGLKSSNHTWKITIFVNMWNLGQFR